MKDQRSIENQIKGIQNQGQCKGIKKYAYDNEDSPLISKQKEIFNKLVDERLDEITKLDKKVNHDDLIYRYKGKAPDKNFRTAELLTEVCFLEERQAVEFKVQS